jgi:hypothetical protein
LPSPDDPLFQPSERQAALLVGHVGAVDRGPVTRARLTEMTIRRLWRRTRIPEAFLLEVQEFLLSAGWALFWAGSSYAIIRSSAVEGWARVSSKKIEHDLDRLSRGRFDFEDVEHLLLSADHMIDDEDDRSE